MNLLKKKHDNIDLELISETIEELTIFQSNLTKVHKDILRLLKGFCYSIDAENTAKKQITDIGNFTTQVQYKLAMTAETESLLRRAISCSRKIASNIKSNTKNDFVTEKYVEVTKVSIPKIKENLCCLEKYIESHSELLKLSTELEEFSELKQIHNNISSADLNFVENTLLISETQNKVIFPYTLKQIKEHIDSDSTGTLTIQKIIDTTYTIPLNTYKNPIMSRFTEAFNLIRRKEHGSLKDAIDLGLELAFNYNLHPAIIAACKNLNELDIYLACLEYNELKDFNFFDIQYEVAPAYIQKFKKSKKLQTTNN